MAHTHTTVPSDHHRTNTLTRGSARGKYVIHTNRVGDTCALRISLTKCVSVILEPSSGAVEQ